MKIYLMRHGQTTGDIEDRFGGDYDDHLTKLGQDQAKELTEKLKTCRIEKIYNSPRVRAVETASEVNKMTEVSIETVDDLRERNAYGVLTGKLIPDVKKDYPELIEQLKDPKETIEGAEPYEDFKQRVLNVFNRITDSSLNTIGLITHGGVISCFLREVIGRERKKLDDCAIIELNYADGKYEIIRSEGLELE